MSFNGSGTFVINSTGQPVVTGTVISSTMFNALTADLATGLSTAFCKDGQSTPTANLPMGGFKLTGLGVATTTGDALSYGQAATVTTLNATTSLTVAALSGITKATAGLLSAATAGTDYAKPDTASTWTAKQTFSGSSSVNAMVLTNAAETITVSATAATGTINYDVSTQSILYYTSNSAANFTVNLRHSSGTTMNTALSTGQGVTVAFLVTNGASPFYCTTVQVDGTTVGVTTKWLSLAPTAGTASGIDAYSFLVIKTGASTFTVLASQSPFV